MGYNAQQIKAYCKAYGISYGSDSSKDSIIREWYTMITTGNHTDWYDKNIDSQNNKFKTAGNGQFNTGKWNNALTTDERNKMKAKIEEYVNSEWSKSEIDNAKNKLTELAEAGYNKSFKDNTGYDMEDAANTAGSNSRADDAKTIYSNNNSPYHHPKVSDQDQNIDFDQTLKDADSFINTKDDTNPNNNINTTELSEFFNPIYNVALIIGTIIAVIIGAVLGIKFMTGSVEQKADTKKLLIPYIAGCVAVFGAFGIWKIVVTILAGM